MTWFKNWPIGIKIALAFGIMAVVVIGSAIFQVVSINRLERTFRGLIDTDIQRIATVQEVSLANERLYIGINHYMARGLQPADKAEAAQRIQTLQDTFEAYESIQSSPGRIAELKRLTTQVVQDAQAAIEVTASGSTVERAQLTFDRSQQALGDALENMTVTEKDVITRANQHISTQVTRLFGSVVAVAVLAAVLGIVLGSIVTFWLNRSVTRVRLGAARFASGDFSKPIPVTSKDEFGELSETFNEMAGRLQEVRPVHTAPSRKRQG